MTQWIKVAEGPSLGELSPIVADMNLTKGTRMRVVMNTWAPWLFDMAGAELAFAGSVPEGMDLIDVWGEGGQGIVELEADPIWMVAALAFIKLHWVALIIGVLAGFVLGAITTAVVVFILKVPAVAQIPVLLIIGAAIGIVGLALLASRSPPRRAT